MMRRDVRAGDRDWVARAMASIDADRAREVDTPLFELELPELDGCRIFIKDETAHPTGSLKHRLARSLFLHAICNGDIGAATIVVEASSGSTAISEAYFALLSNLISNAVKYSAPGSPIDVMARQQSDRLEVHVRDSGIGIPARDRDHLFERYFRGSNATSIAGTGVGLHLVAMVVAMHHGEVDVESLEGVGSRFVIRIPILAEGSIAPQASSARHAA